MQLTSGRAQFGAEYAKAPTAVHSDLREVAGQPAFKNAVAGLIERDPFAP